MKSIIRLAVLFALFISSGELLAQPAFWDDIQHFKKVDSLEAPPANPVLLIGSSTFTRWQKVQNDFPGYTILNRGFGGSSFPDLKRYADDIIFRYDPKQVVIYCGDNDLAGSDTITAQTVFNRFAELFQLIRQRYPKVAIAFVSIKPSPSRWHLRDKAMQTNQMIRTWLSMKKNSAYINIWDAMLGPDGKPLDDIFVEDKLHMNEKGYEIWKRLMQPHLLK